MFLVVFSEVFESWLNELNRAFFVFAPLRQAIILCAGDKTGDKHFYKKMIPLAERLGRVELLYLRLKMRKIAVFQGKARS